MFFSSSTRRTLWGITALPVAVGGPQQRGRVTAHSSNFF
jgi:hypothetical protein